MKNYFIRILLLHFLITFIYTLYTYLLYVYGGNETTLGIGFLQWELMLAHLSITILVCLVMLIRGSNKKLGGIRLFENIVSIIVWIGVHLLLSDVFMDWAYAASNQLSK